jgi:nitroreductase
MKKLLKWIVSAGLIEWPKKTRIQLQKIFLPLASKNKVCSGIYYIFNQGFADEHLAVIRGCRAYYESLKDIGSSCALLRRNTHRLEKGLIMRPRRSVFAEGFIQETVECYSKAIRSPILDENEKKWATDVLDEYFAAVGSSRITEKARQAYSLARAYYPDTRCELYGGLENTPEYKPYQYADLPVNKISFDQLKDLYHRRRSVRWYKDQTVPLNLVQQAANIASFAPSACNRQPYTFYFCNDKAKAVSIAKCTGGTTGFAENLPSIIAIVGDLSVYPFERDRHLIYIDGSLGAMQLMLALETLGLSTCSINWPEVQANEKKIRKYIELKEYQRVVMLLAVGYADPVGGIPYSQKKANEMILKDIS